MDNKVEALGSIPGGYPCIFSLGLSDYPWSHLGHSYVHPAREPTHPVRTHAASLRQ